jgi:hypothetical protein
LFAGESLGEQEVGEALGGGAQDVVVLGRLGGGVELAFAVDDHAHDRAAACELWGLAQEAQLGLHLAQLLVGGVGVLGVDDPGDVLVLVGEDQVEVDPGAGWFPAFGEDLQLGVFCGEVVGEGGEDALSGDPGGGLAGGAGGVLG